MPLRLDRDSDVMPDDARQLLRGLYDEDERSNGNPVVQERDLPLGRGWLQRILIDTLLRMAHVAELCWLYRGAFHPPRPRRDWPDEGRPAGPAADPAFRHTGLLEDVQALAVAEWGVNALKSDELARLLLNPVALWDLADLIDATLPEWWCGPTAERGRELLEQVEREEPPAGDTEPALEGEREPALSLMGAAALEARGADCWRLTFEDDEARKLEQRIAEHLYGEARAFELLLYRQPAEGDPRLLEFELEVAPAPVKNDLTLTVTFPAGEQRVFLLRVPAELKRDPAAKPRPRTRSEPCAPLPAESFVLKGKPEWGKDWPPGLFVRELPLPLLRGRSRCPVNVS
jgi:hypothetical protein